MRRKQVENLNRLFLYLAIGSLVLLAIGLKDIDNYISWDLFLIAMLLAGIVAGVIAYSVLCYFIPEVKTYKNNKEIGILFQLLFLFPIIFLGVGSILNESSSTEMECKEYIIQKMGKSGSSPKAYYIFVNTGNKIERLKFGKDFNEAHKVGDKINLCIVTGRLGFMYFKIL